MQETLFVILIQDGFDAGGFPCARVTKEKTVVGVFSLDKGFCVVDKLFLCNLVAHQVIKLYMGYLCDGDNARIGLCLQMFQTEGFVEAQLAHTKSL